jgi:hypothetical protein
MEKEIPSDEYVGRETQRRTHESVVTWGMLAKLVLVIFLGAAVEACAADTVAGEYRVRRAFLLNFAKFVEWPPETFKSPADPIVVCVLAENPFGPGLARAAQNTVVANRPVTVRQLASGQQASQCQIAFVSASERKLSKGFARSRAGRKRAHSGRVGWVYRERRCD